MKTLHQLVPALLPGDAVSAHTLEVREVIRGLGLESEVYAGYTHPSLAVEARPLEEFDERTVQGSRRDEGMLYQLATGSHVADLVQTLPERKLVYYHNITPPEFFAGWDAREAVAARVGLTQVARLAHRVELAVAPSRFSEEVLRASGYGATAVAPFLFDPRSLDRQRHERAVERLEHRYGSDPVWLFVGRLVPNKAQHDVVKALAAFRRLYGPARLQLVGVQGSKRYAAAVRDYVTALGLDDVVELTGHVRSGELAARYAVADVFVCLSEHEGFCVPLLEALHHGLPVVAYAAAAVPETVGAAALLLDDKSAGTVAAAVERVVGDPIARRELARRARARLEELAIDRTRAHFAAVLQKHLGDLA